MSFSSPATANTSRSPSPVTPEPSDALESVAVRSDFDHSNSWYMHQLKSADSQSLWDIDTSDFISQTKTDDHQMLRLDDLIEQHAYEEYVFQPTIFVHFIHSVNSSPSLAYPSSQSHSVQPNSSSHSLDPVISNFRPSLIPPCNVTKPIPPPTSLPRKQDPSLINQRVVFPPKESCFKCVASLHSQCSC